MAARIGVDVACVTWINHDSHFSWQAHHLVMLRSHFSWQVQHLVKFGMLAGVRNFAFFNTKYPQLRGGLRTDGFMLGSCSDHSRIIPAL